VEGKIVNITAQRNSVVADIQARLSGAANGMTIDQPGAAADESFGQCILTYANQLKTYAADPTPANSPTDCGTPAILPESSHAVLLIVGGGAVMAGALLLVGRRRRMRHRLS
jgi:LPXTG-motif cell wall-anchored protein